MAKVSAQRSVLILLGDYAEDYEVLLLVFFLVRQLHRSISIRLMVFLPCFAR